VVGGLMAEKFGWRLVEKDKYIVDYTTEIMQMEENIGKREAKSQEVRI
jgi:hypothetical protein